MHEQSAYTITLSPLALGLIPVVVAFILACVWWMVRRVIASIDRLGGKLDAQGSDINDLGTRMAVVESKQDRNAQVTTKTARKVGVRLPAELERTMGGSPL